MFENMVLRRIFGPRRDDVTGEWRRLNNEKLNNHKVRHPRCVYHIIGSSVCTCLTQLYGGIDMYNLLYKPPHCIQPAQVNVAAY